MSFNTFGKILGSPHERVMDLLIAVLLMVALQIYRYLRERYKDMDRRRPGQSKFTTRKESDKAIILSGVLR